MHDLNGFERDTLYVVAGQETATGSEIQTELESYYEETIFDSRLYPTLQELDEKGLLKMQSRDGRTNEYRLTRRGVREIQVRQEWEDSIAKA